MTSPEELTCTSDPRSFWYSNNCTCQTCPENCGTCGICEKGNSHLLLLSFHTRRRSTFYVSTQVHVWLLRKSLRVQAILEASGTATTAHAKHAQMTVGLVESVKKVIRTTSPLHTPTLYCLVLNFLRFTGECVPKQEMCSTCEQCTHPNDTALEYLWECEAPLGLSPECCISDSNCDTCQYCNITGKCAICTNGLAQPMCSGVCVCLTLCQQRQQQIDNVCYANESACAAPPVNPSGGDNAATIGGIVGGV